MVGESLRGRSDSEPRSQSVGPRALSEQNCHSQVQLIPSTRLDHDLPSPTHCTPASNSQLGPDSLGRVSTHLSPSRRKRGLGSHEEGKMEQMGCRENKGVIKFSSDRKSNRDITSDRPTGVLINIGKSTGPPTGCRTQRLSQFHLNFTRQDENCVSLIESSIIGPERVA